MEDSVLQVDELRDDAAGDDARGHVKRLLQVISKWRLGEINRGKSLRVRLRAERRFADRGDVELQRPPFQSDGHFLDQIVSALMIDQRAAILRRHVLQQLR